MMLVVGLVLAPAALILIVGAQALTLVEALAPPRGPAGAGANAAVAPGRRQRGQAALEAIGVGLALAVLVGGPWRMPLGGRPAMVGSPAQCAPRRLRRAGDLAGRAGAELPRGSAEAGAGPVAVAEQLLALGVREEPPGVRRRAARAGDHRRPRRGLVRRLRLVRLLEVRPAGDRRALRRLAHRRGAGPAPLVHRPRPLDASCAGPAGSRATRCTSPGTT